MRAPAVAWCSIGSGWSPAPLTTSSPKLYGGKRQRVGDRARHRSTNEADARRRSTGNIDSREAPQTSRSPVRMREKTGMTLIW